MREAADLAIGARGSDIVEVGERMGFARACADTEVLEQRLANEMRWTTCGRTDTEIDVRLAKAHRMELRMAIGEMQEAYVAIRHETVVKPGSRREVQRRAAVDWKPCGG